MKYQLAEAWALGEDDGYATDEFDLDEKQNFLDCSCPFLSFPWHESIRCLLSLPHSQFSVFVTIVEPYD